MPPRPSPADARVTLPLASGYAPCAANPDLWHTKATRRECPRCVGAAVAEATVPVPVRAAPKGPRCSIGHIHDSKGEATCCPVVYAKAAAIGAVVFRPGRPGVPCWSIDPDADTGRPVYVSIDWIVVDARTREIVAMLDYKGTVAKSLRRDKGWARGRRIIETEYGVRVHELASVEDIEAALGAKEAT